MIIESDEAMNPSSSRNGTNTIKKTIQAFTCALQVETSCAECSGATPGTVATAPMRPM